ncbi:ankyrin repeat domain-containing protein [Flagellimonas sp. HMM57]|uniref:ankyrin repeat domain-containing protein n=1 Tax=unclassified Flagellimonas TaxID=2644544 RepID=UPI0013D0357F|nr:MULTISPECIES: ankyrin repeat domain-containing protein [unclassified Flagellimonas]UII77319.1 ankyrin repeat domain-containing protein [Flagellimonas sp. HMM57]
MKLPKLFSPFKSTIIDHVEFSKAIIHLDLDKVYELMDLGKIDVNEYVGFDNNDTILIEAVSCLSKLKGSEKQLELISFLIDKGADVNWKNDDGYNAFHISLAYHNLSKISLLLLRKGNPDVNIVEDKHGNSPIFIAIREYGLTWREEQKEVNQLRFEIIKELLNRGAELDKINNHGISARKWIERVPEKDKLHNLINEFDKK